jgi:tetratricopeptide (TPR) repeat protein
VFAARFDVTKDTLDLRKGFSWFMQANIPTASLRHVASLLWTRYKQGHQLVQVDVDATISLLKRALDTPQDDPSTCLNDLGVALMDRFVKGSQQTDLDEAISFFRHSSELRIPSDPQAQKQTIVFLTSALSIRFKQTGQQSDIDEAISLYRQGLKLHLLSHPEQLELTSIRDHLADALSDRFHLTVQRSDIDEAISLRRQILELLPTSHPERLTRLSILAIELSHRFLLTGLNIDIDDAISLQRQVVVLCSSIHPCQPSDLNILACLLLGRFKQRGQQVDVDEAIYLLRQILETDPNNSTIVGSLAMSLRSRFDRTHLQTDIDESISLSRHLSRSDPDRPLEGLASSLLSRFQLSGQKTDLDESISIYRQCFKPETTTFAHKNRDSDLIHNLGGALTFRYEQEGQQSDIDEAYSLFKQAIDVRISLDHTSLPDSLTAFGVVCIHAHIRSGGETSEYLVKAMSSFSASARCPSQSAYDRLARAKAWIICAEQHGHPSVFNAYEAALQALPQAAALNLDIQSRQEALADSDGLARNAATCAIQAGNLEKAVEFLEGGQSVFWSQVLSLRSPISKLHDIAPELANKLQNIAKALELGSHRDVSRHISNYVQNLSIQEESSRLNRLNEEWAITIDEIRKLEGFENFLRPRRLSALRVAASTSPVVFLVANHKGSHCLILTSTTIHHIDLPDLPTPMLHILVLLVQVGVSQSRVSRSSINAIVETINAFLGENRGTKVADKKLGLLNKIVNKLGSSDDVFKFVLRMLWDNIVNPVIRLLKIQVSA